jgi:hypothetical protein
MFNNLCRKAMATQPFRSVKTHQPSAYTAHIASIAPLSAVEQRLFTIGACLAALAFVGALFGSDIAQLLNLQLNAHGHTHVYAHGHPFVDARVLWGILNAMDVLSNLTFIGMGVWGFFALHRAPAVPVATRQAATVFFTGLLLTCLSSSFYHWGPDAWGLAVDRAGMAMAFASVLGLAAAERVSQRAAPWVWGSVLAAGMLAIMLNFAVGVVAPWAVVQFGGMAVVLWAATQRAQRGAIGIRWTVLIAIYVVAKLLELGDEVVFQATQEIISGHSLKHMVASVAALPVILALRHNAKQGDTAAAKQT